MAAFVFYNNILTTLASPVLAGATSITLTSMTNVPATIPANSYLAITLNDAASRTVFEIVYATSRTGSNLTVIRAQEGTTAQSWSANDWVSGSLTAAELSSFGQSGLTRYGKVTNVNVGVATPVSFSPAFPTAVLSVGCGVSTGVGDLGAYSCHTDSETNTGFNVTVTGGGAATVSVYYQANGN